MVGMAKQSERAKLTARTREAQDRSRELEQINWQLHDHVLETAESVRRSYEQTAETMENLADTGLARDAERRRRAAERSRHFAEEEARQIAELRGRDSRRANDGPGSDD